MQLVDYSTNTQSYAETPAWVEIEPGVQRRIDRCTVNDLHGARCIETQKAQLRAEAELLLADAHHHNLDIDDDLRDRLALWATDLPTIQALTRELRSAVLQPV
jgi:hypothetical protein